MVIALDNHDFFSLIKHWIDEYNIQILNIAGPRESQCPGIYDASFKMLHEFLLMTYKEIDQKTGFLTKTMKTV